MSSRAGRSTQVSVERILNDAPDELDQLPVLQHCLMRLWERAGQQHNLTLELYNEIGGISGALSKHAGDILKSLPGSELAVAQVFRALAEIDRDGRIIRRSLHYSQLLAETNIAPDELRKIVDRFRDDDCSFLTPSKSEVPQLADGTRIDVGHEALLRHWENISGLSGATGEPNDPRAIGWLKDEEADGRRYQALLSLARNDRSGRTVLAPEQIEWWDKRSPTPAWAGRYGGGYELVARLIENSRAALASEQQRLERERASQRRVRVFRFAVPVLLLLLISFVSAGVFIYDAKVQLANAISEQAKATAALKDEQERQEVELLRVFTLSLKDAFENGKISLAAASDTFKPIADYLERHLNDPRTQSAVGINVQLLTIYSDIQTTIGQNEQALQLMRTAIGMAEDLVSRDGSNPDWQHLLFTVLFRAGDIVGSDQTPPHLQEAISYYRKAQVIAQKLSVSKPDDGGRQYDLAFIYNKVGETLQVQQNFPDAKKQFEAALQISRAIAVKAFSEVEWQAYVPITLTKIGTLLMEQQPSDLKGALANFAEALAQQKGLAARVPDNTSILEGLARTYAFTGEALFDRDGPSDFEVARRAYLDAIGIIESLLRRDPGNALWLRSLAARYSRLGLELKAHDDVPGALAQFENERMVLQKIVELNPKNQTWANDLASSQKRRDALKRMLPAVGAVGDRIRPKYAPKK